MSVLQTRNTRQSSQRRGHVANLLPCHSVQDAVGDNIIDRAPYHSNLRKSGMPLSENKAVQDEPKIKYSKSSSCSCHLNSNKSLVMNT